MSEKDNLSSRFITPDQCRAARGLLNWSQEALATAAHVSRTLIATFESGNAVSHNNHMAITLAISEAGVEVIGENGGGEGVRFRVPKATRG